MQFSPNAHQYMRSSTVLSIVGCANRARISFGLPENEIENNNRYENFVSEIDFPFHMCACSLFSVTRRRINELVESVR